MAAGLGRPSGRPQDGCARVALIIMAAASCTARKMAAARRSTARWWLPREGATWLPVPPEGGEGWGGVFEGVKSQESCSVF